MDAAPQQNRSQLVTKLFSTTICCDVSSNLVGDKTFKQLDFKILKVCWVVQLPLSSLYIYHFLTVVDFSSEKYSGSTGHRNSW